MDNEEEFEEIEELSDESDFDSIDRINESSNNVSHENISNNSDSEQLNHNSNETPSNDATNLQQKLDENKANSYNRANSDREAFSKTLDNKNYYNDKLNQLKNDKNQLEKDQKENKQRRDTAEKRLEIAKQNRSNNKNKSTNKDLKNAKKEAKDANEENKEQQRQQKMNQLAQKQVAKDEKKSKRFKALHPVEAAKMQIQNKVNKVKKAIIAKVVAACAPIVLGLVLVFFVIQTILGPIMDAFGHIDQALTGVSNFSESISNFYYGFGFQDSKEAFYEEINGLVERYGTELDVPLLLSTLFYTEGMGYDTSFENIETDGAIDGSVTGSNQNIFNAIRGYMREKFDEANQTVDENGLVYNAGKIYRLRKLARNQFHTDIFGTPTREGKETSMSLSSFMEEYGERIKGSFINSLKNIAGAAVANINAVFKEIWAFVVGSEYQGDFFANAGFAAESAKDSVLDLFADIFYGLADVTGISIGFLKSDEDGLDLFQIYVRVKTFEYDEDNYDKYLREYYIPNMPEFKEMLPSEGEAREAKIDQIINEIHANKQLFKDIFLQYVDTPAETYVEQCVGGIDLDLAKELTLPVKVPEGTTVNFVEGETAFGIRDGTNHNGIDLNSGTAGVNEGDPVYAIAEGEVVNSLPNVSCNTRQDSSCKESQGAWVRIRHNIVIEQKEYNFYSVYMHLQTNSGQPAVGTKVKKGELIGKIGNTGDSSGAHLHFEIRDEDGTANGQPLDPTNLFIPCSSKGFSVHTTSLSKEMFVSKLKAYCSGGSCGNSLNMFAENAETIYDTSVKNNLNPELVVVRAIAEGFSPGGGTYNYWGIGCTNTGGGSDCISYSSLSAGIKGFSELSIVKNSETATDLMKSYAYIGDYWYNPGDAGVGGCYYFPYISQYISSSRVNTINGACTTGKSCTTSGGSCTATTEEDQNAYAQWQVSNNMGKYRKDIFGLED